MMVKCFTALMLAGFAASAVLILCVLCRDAGVRPLRAAGRFARGRGVLGCMLMLPLCVTLFVRAVVKPPTNGVNGVSAPMRAHRTGGVRTPTAEEYAAGFALVRVGTGESFDFSPTPNADVCEEWRRFGAADDRQHISLVADAYDGYAGFPFGTNVIRKLTVFSDGEACVATTNASTTISPLKCVSGILPASHWGLIGGEASQFWSCLTPSNTFAMTWQNVAFARNPGCPVSFQAELYENGDMDFRYDLSALGDGTVSNVVVGAMNEGAGTTFGELPAGTTSLRFARLDPARAEDPDHDGDGITTADELFTYGTNPYEPDSDHDGLGDYAEINETNTDPNDAYSADGVYNDRLAVALGGLDPFSCPDGSTNSVLEHVFYSGTTNGAFAYPVSTDEIGVLKITVSGSGSGRLLVGDSVVPLVGFETNTLLLAVGKGVRKDLRWDVPEGLDVALDSEDLLVGELPTPLRWKGWLAFPHTDAEIPCIHDLSAKRKTVSLVHGEEIPGLTAEWSCESEDVDIGNRPPVSAEITGNFSTRESRAVSYTVDHPKRLNPSPVVVAQTLRFCPSLSVSSEEVADAVADEYEPYSWFDDPTDSDDATIEEDAADEYDRISALPSARGVLQLHGSVGRTDVLSLDTPEGDPVRCCECPDHWRSNYVALAWRSWRLAVEDMAGAEFSISREDVHVSVRGTSPSREPDGDGVLFVTNGAPYIAKTYTVLGVGIESPTGVPLVDYNALSPSFGFPVTVCTNLERAARLLFRTDVLLSNGVFRIAVEDATAPFQLWAEGWAEWDEFAGAEVWHPPMLLLDSEDVSERHFTTRQWRRLVAERGEGRSLSFYVMSSATGRCDVVVSYVFDEDGSAIQSAARQRVTSVNPPLLPDYGRDGRIDMADIDAYLDGCTFRYWTNEDTAKGDYLGQVSDDTPNAADLLVNGRLDLVNLFPLKLDLKPFIDSWGSEATFVLWEAGDSLHFCGTDMSAEAVWEHQTNEVYATTGENIVAATLRPISVDGSEIAPGDYLGNGNAPGILAFEAANPVYEYNSPMLLVLVDGIAMYSFRLPLSISPVMEMYGWINSRHLSGEGEARTTALNRTWGGEDVKSLLFLHGANVSEAAAEKWGDALFKRLWLSGAHVDFYNVDWRSDIGSPANYQQNASNAFVVASRLFSVITNAIPGEKVVMAHSLGNMVVSSMIQDHGLQVSKYLMCDSAVPSEAYYPAGDESIRVPQLVHPEWEEYPTNSWASNWHKLFAGDQSDDRRKLGWPGRFLNVPGVAVNFYSTGDEVLELSDDNDIYVWTGATSGFVQYSWHHQELWKGRGAANALGGTTWSGWNIEEDLLGVNKISVSEALRMSPEDFKTNTVFYCYPTSMNSTNISLLVRAAHLTQGIPALARPTGGTSVFPVLNRSSNYNLDHVPTPEDEEDESATSFGLMRPNGWPARSKWNGRWLHSDMKDVSYFYNFMFYETVVEKGNLR